MKHRVWCHNNNEWEKDETFIDADGNVCMLWMGRVRPVKANSKHSVQFSSGIEDKNGVEIYAGDFVKFYHNHEWYTLPVSYHLCKFAEFCCGVKGGAHFSLRSGFEFDIVGNIHEGLKPVIVTAEGQINKGDKLQIVGKSTLDDQITTAKEIIIINGKEEVLIDIKENRYFITSVLISGGSWAKQVCILNK